MANTISRVDSLKRKYGKRYFQRMGARGGKKTVELYGTNYFRLLGLLGNNHLSKKQEIKIRREIREVLSS